MYKLQTTKLLSSNFLGIKVDQDCDQGTEWQKAGRQYQYHAPPRQCKSGSGPQGPTDQPTNSGIKETSLGNCTTGWGCLSVTEKTEFADGPWLRDSSWKTQEIWARVSESNRFQKQQPCLWLQKWSLCRSSIMTPISVFGFAPRYLVSTFHPGCNRAIFFSLAMVYDHNSCWPNSSQLQEKDGKWQWGQNYEFATHTERPMAFSRTNSK